MYPVHRLLQTIANHTLLQWSIKNKAQHMNYECHVTDTITDGAEMRQVIIKRYWLG